MERVTVVNPYPRTHGQGTGSEPRSALVGVTTVPGYDLDPRLSPALFRCCLARTFKPVVSERGDYQPVRCVGISSGYVDINCLAHWSTSIRLSIGYDAVLSLLALLR